MSQELEFGTCEYTLGEADGETLDAEQLKNLVEMMT